MAAKTIRRRSYKEFVQDDFMADIGEWTGQMCTSGHGSRCLNEKVHGGVEQACSLGLLLAEEEVHFMGD